MEDLKHRVKDFEERDIERKKEISDLNCRLEMLYATVEQLVTERADIFREPVKSATVETTPTVRKLKKRRKVKQHPTPSPTKNQPAPRTDQHHDHDEVQVDQLVANNHDDDRVLTAEEIAKLYEDEETDPDEN